MELIKENGLSKLIPSEGLVLKSKTDIYVKASTDDLGNTIPEHLPFYSSYVYLPESITLEMAKELYDELSLDDYPWKPDEPTEPEEPETMDSIWEEVMLNGTI